VEKRAMRLTKSERDLLLKLMAIGQKVLDQSSTRSGRNGSKPRMRRSRADVAFLKKEVRAALRRKVPVKVIAGELDVTPAYIYQLAR
jgi:hypothetical protein